MKTYRGFAAQWEQFAVRRRQVAQALSALMHAHGVSAFAVHCGTPDLPEKVIRRAMSGCPTVDAPTYERVHCAVRDVIAARKECAS